MGDPRIIEFGTLEQPLRWSAKCRKGIELPGASGNPDNRTTIWPDLFGVCLLIGPVLYIEFGGHRFLRVDGCIVALPDNLENIPW